MRGSGRLGILWLLVLVARKEAFTEGAILWGCGRGWMDGLLTLWGDFCCLMLGGWKWGYRGGVVGYWEKAFTEPESLVVHKDE